jgi:hypothetical protein
LQKQTGRIRITDSGQAELLDQHAFDNCALAWLHGSLLGSPA